MSSVKNINVIIRNSAEKTVITGEGNLSVAVSAPSVIEINGSAQDVARYVRQGKDLLIYMKDGSVIRCNNYFVEDAEGKTHSELVFNDQQELTHITFADTGESAGLAATELTAQATPISSIEPLLEQGSLLSDAPWGWIAGAALGGGAIGALLANGGSGDTRTEVIDNTQEVESATPTFLVSDKQGDKQGLLSAGDVTDDSTPTFNGTGQPGATIQIKDSSGNTIASTMVGSNGSWTVKLPVQTDGEHSWSVVQIDGSKTTSAGNITLTVSTAEATVTPGTIAGDNVINASEQSAGFTLSGASTNLAQGTALSVTLNGKTYSAEVGANGAWSVNVPVADAAALTDGTWTVAVSGKDAAGNNVTANQTLNVDTRAPTLSVDTVAQDNIINAAEQGQPVVLSGKTNAEAGQTVTVTLNGQTHTATVGSDGTWSLTLSASEVKNLAEGDHTLTASVSDKAGNTSSSTANFAVDTAAPVVTVNTVAGDDVLNTSEQGQAQIISGQAAGAAAGDVVTVTLNGQIYTGVVQANGSWSVGVPASAISALGEGNHTLSVSVTDAAGNTGNATHNVTLSGAPPEFTLDTISQDNVLNAQEALQPLTLSGTSNLADGSNVTVTLNNVTYQTTVEGGVWSLQVPVTDVLNLANTIYKVTVSGTDSVGNSGSAEGNLLVDTALPQVFINTFAGDNLVNNAEVAVDQTLSGRVTGASAGDIVSVIVGGKNYSAEVGSDLTWSVTIPASDLQSFGDGNLTFSASVTNTNGNTGSGERDININAELPGLRVNTISGDDVINAIEQRQDLTVTGSSSHLAAGSQVTVSINGIDYQTVVTSNGSWQIGVPAADLQNWSEGQIVVTASAEDNWGNTVSVEHPVVLDLNAVAVTLDTVSSDDMLNAAEKGSDLTLSGQTQGVEAGQTVVVKFAGQTFTAQVEEDGSWSLTLPASAMENLTDGRAQIDISVTNVNGNSADTSRVVTVDTQAPTLTIDSIASDNVINAAEAQQDLVLSGTSNAEAGQPVTVMLNGKQYETTVQNDGTWQLSVPAADVAELNDGIVTVTASVSDVAGNNSSADRAGLVDATIPQVTINDFVTSTNTINQAAHGQAQVLTGSVTGAAAGDIVTVTLNNQQYTTVVDANGNWSLGLPASVIQGLADGSLSISVSVTDQAGNTGSNVLDVTVNTATPEISINTLAVDDVINAVEKVSGLQLSGSSNQPEGTQVTVTLNGINYTTTTAADGSWSLIVPPAAVGALGEANYTVSAAVTDAIGNSASDTHDVRVDSALPVVTINTLAGDNVVNAAEVASGQTLSGRVTNAAAGDTVTVTVGGREYTTTVNDDLSWSVELGSDVLTALGNGALTAGVSVTNGVGNSGSASLDFVIDANLPGLRVDTVAGDDVINVIEHGQNLIVTGSSTGLAAGSNLTVTINGAEYPATVLADGSWSAAVPAADVGGWAAGSVTVTVAGESSAGNPVSISHGVTVDLAAVAITVGSVTADNVLNAAEKGQDLVLSGATANVEAGQPVTVTFGGRTYRTEVDADGNWSLTVPAADLAGLKDGDAVVQASVSSVSGNAAAAQQGYSVDATAPSLTIGVISENNILNAAEAGRDLTLSGTSTAEAGQTVTVTFNGREYSTEVLANGSWTLDVPAADLAGIADGVAGVTASVADKAGNPAGAGSSVLVDTTVPELRINTVAGDDVINAAEHGQALIVSGSVSGAAAGDVVTVTVGEKSYTTVLDAAGNWSVGVPAADVSALNAGNYTITAALTDKAGNSGSTTHDVAVNLSAPELAVDTISGDDVINATEKGADLQLSGSSNQPEGTQVTVTLNGINYNTTTGADGSWSVTVPASAVGALGEANYTVSAAVTDAIGNSASATHDVRVDSALPAVTINTLAGDNVVNAAEVASGQTLSGRVTNAAAGDNVTVTVGGREYTTTVNDDLSWSVELPAGVLTALGNGALTAGVSVTNGVGNSGSASLDFVIDANLPGLRVDTVAGDDVINVIEHGQNLIVTGSSSGLAAGSNLTVTINGAEYPATVLADGSWSAAVPAADVGGWAAGSVTVTVAGESAAGNPVSISHGVTVDLAAVAITVGSVTADNVLNAAEKGQDLVLSGATANVEAGQPVTVTFGGRTYRTEVDADGNWSLTVPAADLAGLKDGDAVVQASVSSVSGNAAAAQQGYSVDATAPSLTIGVISENNILNAAEAGRDLTLSGTSTAEAGQTVTVTFNGREYSTEVLADGSWTLDVPAADLAGIADGVAGVTASVADKAGNPAGAGSSVLVDTTVPELRINTVAGDDVINAAEHGQALIVSGSVSGAAAGDVVTVTVGEKSYTTTLDAAGNWSVGVPAADVGALNAGNYTITAALTDKAGNSGSTTHGVEVNLSAPELAVDTISGDDVINATEKGADLQLSGSSNQPEGTQVTVTLNGINYNTTTAADGSWSVTVPASAVGALGEANYTVSAAVTDAIGNSASATHDVRVDSALPVVTINTLAGDNVVNAAEVASGQTLSGRVTNAAAGDNVTVTVGGREYTTTVNDDLSWSVELPAGVLTALGNGALTAGVSVTNGVGNSGSASLDFVIDANLPGLRVDTVAGDDVINVIEHGQNLIVTGSSSGLAAGSNLTVTINGAEYPATVLADGSWSAAVPAADVGGWAAGSVTVTVAGESSAGNPVSISHGVTVDLAAVAITVGSVTADNVLNAAEKGQDLVLSGATANVEAGQPVTVTFGGRTYRTEVDADGNWSLTVPAADLAGLKDGDAVVQASVSSVSGNAAAAQQGYSVDATAPSLTIGVISENNVLNAAEAGRDLTLSGTSTAEAGQTVTVTFNGREYSTEVLADGSWTLDVPAADLAGIADGVAGVTASVADKAGNPAGAGSSVLVDTTVPELRINTVAGDDVINAAEHGQALIVSGSVSGAAAGDVVTVTVGEKSYTTVLDAAGNWSVGVPAADVGALNAGAYTITAALTDKAGNSGSTTHDVAVNLSTPVLTIDTISGDDLINNAEKTQDLVISGSATGLVSGTVVTVVLNGKAYSAEVDAEGNWSTTVPADQVSALGEALYDVSASATNSVGNSASTTHTINVESVLPGVIINAVAGDDVINAAELAAGQTLSGRVTNAAEGDTVTVTVGGREYTTTVNADLSWSLELGSDVLTALGNGALTIGASVTNGAGNSGSGTRDVTVDANLPGLRIDTVAGDDVINVIEHGQNLIVTGSSSGLAAGSSLTVTINGAEYPATVLADGSWSAAVPAADVGGWPAGSLTVTAAGESSAGNPVSISHGVTVDLAAVAITVGSVTADNVLNAAEKGQDLVLSGATANVEAGQPVTVTFGGRTYRTEVDADGNWSLTVPAADLAGLKDGDAVVQAGVSSVSGNAATAGREYSVDATAPSLTIGTVSGDNVLNAAEAGRDLTLSGTSTAEAGQTVTVTFNGREYSTEVLANGSWTLDVPAADLAGIADGVAGVTASVADKAGNPASASHNLTVDVTVPVVTINTVAGDDVINLAEHGQAQVISGSASGAAAGDRVTVTVGGQSYTTVLDAAGNWSVGLPAAAVSALQDGTETIAVSVTDAAGNTGGGTRDVSVDTGLPSLGFDAISGDNVLNAAEKGQDLTVSGTSSGLAENTAVTVTLNGKTYDATTAADGSWSLTVPAADLAALGEANYTLSATASSGVGNSVSAGAGLQVNTALPGVFINAVAGDDVINAAELAAGQTLSGRVTNAAEGDTVTVTVGGREYTTTVNADLSWSLELGSDVLTALGNGALTIGASVTNGAGNSGSGTRDVTVDANLPGLRIDTVAGDDVINVIEHGQNLIVTGSSSGLAAGSSLTVTINGAEYPATVLADGSWSAAVPAADVGGWPAGSLTVTAAGESSAGNPVSISHGVTVDLAAVAITVGSVTADNVLNAAEKGQDLVLSGATANVEAGQPVTVTFGGRTYRTEVDADGNWSLTVPAADLAGLKDGDAVVQAGVSSVSGNAATAGREYSVDATAPSLTIGTVSGDNVLNAAEAGRDLTLSGTSTAEAGQTVTVTFNGREYSTEVLANGSWTLDVPAADLAGIADGVAGVTASVADKAGNPASASHNLTVDVTVPVVTINTVAGDDVINLAEHGQAQVISGSASGAAAGDRVTVTVGGQSYTTVLDAAGNWSVGLPAAAVSALQDGTETIAVSVTDAAGNTGGGTRDVSVDTGLPSLGFDAISGDNVLNAAEKGQDLTVSGTSSGLAENTAVTVTLNGKTYDATTAADGSWSLTVPAADLAALGEANYTLSATASSGVGNSVSAGAGLQVNTALPGVFINAVAGDDVINAAELAAGQTLSGRVTNAAEGDTVTVTVGGREYTTTVNADLSWSLELGSDVLTALGNGGLTIGASVTNGVGNSGSGTRDVTVDANLPGLRIDTVAGDDVINVIEHGQNLIVTGSSSGLAAGSSLTVTINGAEYPATVLADGSWSAAVPAADVGGWPAGSLTVTAAGESAAGNPVSISHGVTVDLAAVAITVGSVTADNVLNAAEKGQDLVLSGATANVEAGQPVTVTFGGRTYRTEVDADGNWSLTVPAADLAGLKDGDAVVQAGVSSVSGNAATAGREYSVDATAPSLTIGTVSGDNVLNAAEAGRDLTLSGTSTAEAGQTVTVTFNGREYSTEVLANGSWTLDVPAADLAGIADGVAGVTASVADKAGNPASASHNLTVDVTVPVVTINTVAGDDVINLAEHGQAQVISGSASGAAAGDRVTVTVGGQSYTTVLDAAGNWSVGLPAAAVSALQDGTETIAVSVTDAAGNTGGGTRDVSVDTGLPSLGFDAISGDNVLNAAEKGQDLTVSGTSSGLAENTAVTVTLNGKTYDATTAADGSWSLTVPAADLAALGEANYTLSATASSGVGNSVSAGAGLQVNTALPGVFINAVAGDDVINAAELAAGQTLSGRVTNAAEGDTVTVTVGGREYTTTVNADLSWSLELGSDVLTALGNGALTIGASVTNGVGNSGSATRDVTVDANLPGLRIDTVAGDDVINVIEHGQNLIVTGSSSGLAAGSSLTVTINGAEYPATVLADGSWSAAVPAADVGGWPAGSLTVTAAGESSAGNPVSISHGVTVDLAAVAITVGSVTADNVLNAAEKGQDLVLSGATANVEAGQPVTVTFGGRTYRTEVDADGNWSLTVPAADLAGLKDGDAVVQAGVSSVSGNAATAGREYSVDATAPSLTIGVISENNVLNAAEAGRDLTLSGTSTAEAGQTVTVTFNGREYSTGVQADGSWTLDVPAADLAGIANGSASVTASVADKAGNPANTGSTLFVDTTVPVLTINTVAGDDVINAAEHGQAQIISGSVTGAQTGDVVTVTLGDKSYTTTLDASGNWSVGVSAADVSALNAGVYTITAALTDKAGNSNSAQHTVNVTLSSPELTINAIAIDDVINAAEKGADLVLSGTTTNVEAGQQVTLTFGGKTYSAEVGTNGSWSYTVPAADLAGLKNGDAVVQASVSNVSGNGVTAERGYTVDASTPTLTIDTISGDNMLNAAEAGQDLTLSGTSSAEAGQIVTVTFNGKEYSTEVLANGSWTLDVPAADMAEIADGTAIVTASVANQSGNPASASHNLTVDVTVPVVTINTVAGDDVINAVEHGQAQIISGSASGAAAGDVVTVTIGDNSWTTTLNAAGNWSVGIPAAAISALQDGTVTIGVSVTDTAGNTGGDTHNVTVETGVPSLGFDAISGDNVLNAVEKGQDLTVSGTSSGLAENTTVTVTLNGKNYEASTTANGSWTLTVPATDVANLVDGGSYSLSASAQSSAGNSAAATDSISVDTTAPVISIATLAGDNVLNAAEQQQPLTINGSTSAEAGQTVRVTLGEKTYETTVSSDGTWTLNVPASDLAELDEGALTVTASVNDKAGNNGQATHPLTVDTVAPTVTINTVAGDDIVNNSEQLAGQTVSGTSTAEQGQTVIVTFGDRNWQTTVDADGNWSVFIPGRDFLGLSDGGYEITASVSDKAGNPGSTSRDVTLSGEVPTITVDTFAGDDIVSAAEHGTPLVISGTTTAPVGERVTITLNDKTYTTTVQEGGRWSYTVGSADVTALADGGAYVINAQVSNAIGNSASDDRTVTVELAAPSMGISIDSLQNDTGLSATDFITNDSQVVVQGSLTAQLGNNEKAQISLDGGVSWIDLTVTATNWSYSDSRTLTDGSYTYQVRVVDNAGNVGATDSQIVVVDLTAPVAPTITVDAITQDTGLSDSDFITSDNQITLSGTLGAGLGNGDHAQISIDGGVTWTDVNVSGLKWTYVDGRTLQDGDYNYQLRVIDDAGNISATTNQVVTIDTTGPAASKTVSIDSISDDTGLSNSDFITNDTSLTLHGSLGATLAADEFVQISLDGGNSWQNVTVIGTNWNFTDGRTLENQTYNYWVRVVDTAGNVGATAQQQVTVDTIAPDAAITVSVDNITVDTGFDNNDFLTSATSYTLHGTLGAGLGANEFVQVSMDGGTTWVYATVDGTSWSYTDARTLIDGAYNYQVRVVDVAGNVGATTSQRVTVDTEAPQYGITVDAISEDTGQSDSDFITNDTSLTVSGSIGSTLASDERVQISLDGGTTWVDATVTNRSWSYTDTRELTDGDYTYQVRIIDQAGNVGSTAQQVVTVDTTPPSTQGTVVSYTDETGERQGDFGASVATDDTSPVINGSLNQALADGEIAELYRDGVLLGQVTMNGATSWYFQDSSLRDGNHTYVMRITDTAGNYTDSDDFVLKVDTSVPTTTAVITAQTTTDTTPIISGTVSAALANGEYLVVTVDGKTYTSETGGAVVVDPNNSTWYLQIPDSAALGINSYDVTAQVKSSAGNGNTTGIANGSLTVGTESINTSWASSAGVADNSTMTLGLNSSGLWNIIANGQSYSSSAISSYSDTALTNTRGANVVSQTSADFDRNGTADVFGTETSYAGGTQVMWTYNGSSYTASQLAVGTTIWYGGVMAYDKTGDGYVDLAYGDSGFDSKTYVVNNNGTLVADGTNGNGGFAGQFVTGREISGVDINNDGTVDIVQHTNLSGANSMTVINNNGNGTLSIGQNLTGVFVANANNTTTAASMTWADFNGDGYMDLYIGSSLNNTGGVIYYNDGNGQLSAAKSAVEASNATAGYLSVAVDWNGDGQMDVIKLSTYSASQTATLFTNNNHGSSWTTTQLASSLVNVTGIAALDYNWDGTQDLLISQRNGQVVYVQNNQAIADGTAMHLRIVDSEGINVYYGNTVNLYNAAGALVASQIINAQSGIGVNDSSALVSFYGLNPNETYSAEIVKITNGVSDNVTWDGLEAGNGKESYVLTAEAANGGNSGTITGTGYNDTFIAEEGTYTYNGSGGWNTTSDHDTWSSTGGMDVVDYRNATSGVTVDLSISTAQDTGFNTSRLVNIEGITGSDFDDVITGNSGDNLFEGRGGNDTFNIGSGGHDTLLYKLINAADATGGNGSDVVNGFTVGTWEGTADTDRIDLRELLTGSGYTGSGSASYVNGVAALDAGAGNLTDYIRVVQNGSNTEIQIDRDGSGGQFDPTTVVTLNGVQTDLATLLANHQLLVV